MADVSKKLMGQFADNLSGLLDPHGPVAEEAAAEPEASEPPAPEEVPEQVRIVDAPEAAAFDLLGVAGAPVLKRLAPVVVAVVVLVVVILVLV
jgi:hypothetical protein